MNGLHCWKAFGILLVAALSLEGATDHSQEVIKAQPADLQDQVMTLQADVIQQKNEKDQALAERALHKAAANAAQAAGDVLRERLVEEQQRVDLLARALRELQQQAGALEAEAREEFTELEFRLSQRTQALQEARNRIVTLEGQLLLRESERERISEKFLLEQNALHAALQAERERVEAALEKIQSHERALQAQLQARQQAAEVALQAGMDKIALLQAELAERDAERDALLAQLSQSAIMLALQEIANLEREVTRMHQQRAREQESLGSRILALEQALADITAERDALQAQRAPAP